MGPIRLPPVHPGEILQDFITGTGASVEIIAADMNMSVTQLHRLLTGEQSITGGIAVKLGNRFGTTPRFWINVQDQYDQETGATMNTE